MSRIFELATGYARNKTPLRDSAFRTFLEDFSNNNSFLTVPIVDLPKVGDVFYNPYTKNYEYELKCYRISTQSYDTGSNIIKHICYYDDEKDITVERRKITNAISELEIE